MQRRDFLKSTVAVAVAAELGIGKAQAKVPAHNWGNFDFGSGPQVTDRLNQGPFPQYPPDAVIPTDDVVMTTTPSEDAVPNYGKGLVTYITADSGTEEIKSDNIPRDRCPTFAYASTRLANPKPNAWRSSSKTFSWPIHAGARSAAPRWPRASLESSMPTA